MSAHNGFTQFVNDDGYLRWLAQNSDGFVVNSNRVPVSSYLILHRASCKWINTPDRTNWTTTGYIKTCSNDLTVLSEWAEQEVGGSLKPCKTCKLRNEDDVFRPARGGKSLNRGGPASAPPAWRDQLKVLSVRRSVMAITHILQIMALSVTAFGSVFLIWACCRSRIRRLPIDSEYEQILDRRLQELRQECLDSSTQRRIADQIRLILDRGREPLCLPPPHSACQSRSTMKP